LVITLVPEFAGRLEMARSLFDQVAASTQSTLAEFPGFNRMVQLQAAPALRSIRLHDDLDRSTLAIYSSGGLLGLDGSGSIVLGHPHRAATSTRPSVETVMVYDEHVVADVINGVSALARHAARSGATGNVSVTTELVGSSAMVIGQYRSMFKGQLTGTRVVVHSTGRSEHAAALEGLVTPGRDLIALARLITGDLFSAFGLPGVQQITRNDELVLDRFYAQHQEGVAAWAVQASVPVVPSWSEA
jgi:hypothetical protein